MKERAHGSDAVGRSSRVSWRHSDWTLWALAVFVVLFLAVAIPLAFRAVGDVRQLVTFSPISTDESRLVKMVIANLETGRFGAHRWYDYGGFYFMLCLATAYVARAFVTLTEPTILILSRLVSVLFGALSLVLLYLCGRRLLGRVVALLAVVIMGVSWVFVVWSVSDHPDIPQLPFVLLALFGCIRLVESGSPRWLWFASLCAGLAFSIKYVGLFMWPVIVLSLVLSLSRHCGARSRKQRLAYLAVGGAVSGGILFAVFFATTPYALVNLGDFVTRIQYTSQVASVAKFGVPVPGTVWLEEISSVAVLGLVLAALAAVYAIIFGVRYVKQLRSRPPLLDAQLVIVAWTLLFLGYLYWRIDYHPPHYLLPILPGLCLLAAAGTGELVQLRGAPHWLRLAARAAVCVVVAVSLAVRGEAVLSFALDRLSFSPADTPLIQAGVWLERTFPAETRIGSDASYNYIPAAFGDVAWDDPAEADVVLVNRASAGTFDSPSLADGYVNGRESYLKMYEFYRMLLDPDRRPPHLLPLRDFGAVAIYLNVESMLQGNATVAPVVATDSLVLPPRQTQRDAVYVFSAQESEQISTFAGTWGEYATREDIRGKDGELLAAVFRVTQLRLPDAEFPMTALQAGEFPLKPERLTGARFGRGLELLGYTVLGGPAPGWPLDVVLFWRGEGGVGADYTVFVHALDSTGRLQGVGDKQPLDGRYPTSRWKKGEVIIDRFTVPVNPCAPAGSYNLEVGLYQPADGRRLALDGAAGGTAVLLGPVEVQPTGIISGAEASPARRIEASIPGQPVQVFGFDQEHETAHAGQPLRVTLYWRANGNVPQVPNASLELKPESGESIKLWDGQVGPDRLSSAKWPEGQAVCQSIDVRLPDGLPKGRYEWEAVMDGGRMPLGGLAVTESRGSFEMPAPERPGRASLGGDIAYLGSDGLPDLAQPGTAMQVSLYWQAVRAMDESYKVFVHLVGPDGEIVTQRDSIPLAGEYQTREWSVGEVIRDTYDLAVPGTAQPGEYRVSAGFYNEATGQRLEISGSATNSLSVGTVHVGP